MKPLKHYHIHIQSRHTAIQRYHKVSYLAPFLRHGHLLAENCVFFLPLCQSAPPLPRIPQALSTLETISATIVSRNDDYLSPNLATVAKFGDCSSQCGQAFRKLAVKLTMRKLESWGHSLVKVAVS